MISGGCFIFTQVLRVSPFYKVCQRLLLVKIAANLGKSDDVCMQSHVSRATNGLFSGQRWVHIPKFHGAFGHGDAKIHSLSVRYFPTCQGCMPPASSSSASSTARGRCQWALPDLNSERQMSDRMPHNAR